jgi:hypothetical protein
MFSAGQGEHANLNRSAASAESIGSMNNAVIESVQLGSAGDQSLIFVTYPEANEKGIDDGTFQFPMSLATRTDQRLFGGSQDHCDRNASRKR